MGSKKSKRFIWIKLSDDFFFTDLKIKKLRKLAGGDTFTIIYLKLMLIAKNTDGVIEYEGLEKTIEEELALKTDEEPENILITMNYLKSVGMLEVRDNFSIYLPQVETLIGSESESAERTRKYRERLKQKTLEKQDIKQLAEENEIKISSHCDEDVTTCDENVTLEKEIDIKTLTLDTLYIYINNICARAKENLKLKHELERLGFNFDISLLDNLEDSSKANIMLILYAINEIFERKL